MRLGCCQPIDKAGVVAFAGYDYIECPVSSLQPDRDRAYFHRLVQPVFLGSRVPAEVFNVLLPRGLAVVGPQVDSVALRRYLLEVLWRVHAVGGRLVVFGSGPSRRIPPGFDPALARAQLLDVLRQLVHAAELYDVRIAMEALEPAETNLGNTLLEVEEIVGELGDTVGIVADLYHLRQQGEPLSELRTVGHRLWHVHVADSGRLPPGTGDYPWAELAQTLRSLGYTGRVSVECRWRDLTVEAEAAQRFLRPLLG